MAPTPPRRRLMLQQRPVAVLCSGAAALLGAALTFAAPGKAPPAAHAPPAASIRPGSSAAPSALPGNTMSAGVGVAAVSLAGLLAMRAAQRSSHGKNKASARRAANDGKEGSVQQLLGMKGAADTEEEPLWKIRLQLCKPVTWPPLLFGVVAGVCASGNFDWGAASSEDYAKLVICMFLSGPVMVGYTQTLNDWYDKDLDAINEPYRPIPSGRITEEEVWQQIYFLAGLGVSLAALLDVWQGHSVPSVSIVAWIGLFMAYIYSAEPLKLKKNWLSGCYALGSSYIALPWWAGQSVFGEVTPEIVVLTLWYSVAAIGIAIVNDFKSIEGDKKLGLSSAPVVFGVDTAKYMAPAFKDLTQLTIVAYLLYIGETPYALGLLALMIPQVFFAKTLFFENPLDNDVKYQGFSLPFFSIGTIVAASAIGNNPFH